MDTVLDKNLQDEMLKLVRYKILFVRREYEAAFPEQEDIVSDNLDGDAFSAWKVAEFIQDLDRSETRIPARWLEKGYPPEEFRRGDFLTGIPHEDKKYLRVYYEVLERYAREKFKYEEQQIRVLEEIRDKVADTVLYGSLLGDPYNELQNRLNLSAQVFDQWRSNFSGCAQNISRDLAQIFNKYRHLGHLEAPEITEQEIRKAITAPPPFSRETLDRFTGPTVGDIRIYVVQGRAEPEEIPTPPLYSIWGPAIQTPNSEKFTQRITGSPIANIDPQDNQAVWKAIARHQLNPILNVYAKNLGLVTWTTANVGPPSHLRSLGYELGGKILWINQWLNPDMTPLLGTPPAQPYVNVKENQLILSIDFLEKKNGKTGFCVYAIHIDFDFKKCSAKFAGPIMKMRHELISSTGSTPEMPSA
jgi:hypothetical protein